MKLSSSALAVSLLVMFTAAACSTSQSGSTAPAKSKEEIRAEKIKAKEEANAKKFPQAPAGSPMAKIKPGMGEDEVREILGPPTSQRSYETGKRWIPGYGAFAPDQRRTEFTYKGLGLVTFNQNQYSGKLVVERAVYDPSK